VFNIPLDTQQATSEINLSRQLTALVLMTNSKYTQQINHHKTNWQQLTKHAKNIQKT